MQSWCASRASQLRWRMVRGSDTQREGLSQCCRQVREARVPRKTTTAGLPPSAAGTGGGATPAAAPIPVSTRSRRRDGEEARERARCPRRRGPLARAASCQPRAPRPMSSPAVASTCFWMARPPPLGLGDGFWHESSQRPEAGAVGVARAASLFPPTREARLRRWSPPSCVVSYALPLSRAVRLKCISRIR